MDDVIATWCSHSLRSGFCVCRAHARTIAGKSQLFINAYGKALEVIPRQLCDNAGFDATDVLNKLRQVHAAADGSGKHFGVDLNTGGVLNPIS